MLDTLDRKLPILGNKFFPFLHTVQNVKDEVSYLHEGDFFAALKFDRPGKFREEFRRWFLFRYAYISWCSGKHTGLPITRPRVKIPLILTV